MMKNFMTRRAESQEGFTLVEVLLYLVIVTTLLMAISTLLWAMLQSRTRSQAATEVEEQAIFIIDHMTSAIRNAEGITAPAVSTSDGEITIDVFDVADDPMVYRVANGALLVRRAGGEEVELTSNLVEISNLVFTNRGTIETPATVDISFTLTRVNPEDRQEFFYTKEFTAEATVRQQ